MDNHKVTRFMASPAKAFGLAAGVIILLLLIGTFWDWPISQAVINQNSWFSAIFQDFGLWPIPFIVMLSCMVIVQYGYRNREQPGFIRLLEIFGALCLAGWQLWFNYLKTTIYYALTIQDDLRRGAPIGTANSDGGNLHLSWAGNFWIWIIVFVVFIAISQAWLSRKNDQKLNRLVKVAIVAAFACIVANDAVTAMKNYWGRWRPYELAGNPMHFTPWYHPNGMDNHMSFPSGHTTAAAGLMLLAMFVDRDHYRAQQWVFWCSLAYCVIMWATRIRIGAHFLTDATSGLWIVWLAFYIILSITHMHLVEWNEIAKE